MIVAIIIEKGPNKEFIKPREAPRIRRKTLKRKVMESVYSINVLAKDVNEWCNRSQGTCNKREG